jgi:hypothetical protein
VPVAGSVLILPLAVMLPSEMVRVVRVLSDGVLEIASQAPVAFSIRVRFADGLELGFC